MSSTRRVQHFLDQHPWLSVQQRTVLRALTRCRTAALGGHVDQCGACGHRAISYNSCRNRHCPKCQAQARARWLAARERELLDVPLRACRLHAAACAAAAGYRNATQLYTWLFQASAATLREVAANPRHLGAEIGVLSILHTWGQTLVRHPHVHCVVPAGGLSPDHQRWIRPEVRWLLPPDQRPQSGLSREVCRGLRRAYGVATWTSPARPRASAIRRSGTPSSTRSSRPTGSSTRNRPSVGRQPCCGTGALHPSRRDQQPPLDRLRRRACDLSVEGLRARQSVAHDDAHRDGISPALRPACAATWLRPDSAVWLPRQRVSHRASRARSAPAPTAAPPANRPRHRRAWHCPRCGAPMVIGPILSGLQLTIVTLGFDTS